MASCSADFPESRTGGPGSGTLTLLRIAPCSRVKGCLELWEACLAWAVKVTDEYAGWFTTLIKEDLGSAIQVAQAVAALREEVRRWAARSLTGSRARRCTT